MPTDREHEETLAELTQLRARVQAVGQTLRSFSEIATGDEDDPRTMYEQGQCDAFAACVRLFTPFMDAVLVEDSSPARSAEPEHSYSTIALEETRVEREEKETRTIEALTDMASESIERRSRVKKEEADQQELKEREAFRAAQEKVETVDPVVWAPPEGNLANMPMPGSVRSRMRGWAKPVTGETFWDSPSRPPLSTRTVTFDNDGITDADLERLHVHLDETA